MSLLNLPFLMPSGGRFSIQDLSPFCLFSCSNFMNDFSIIDPMIEQVWQHQ